MFVNIQHQLLSMASNVMVYIGCFIHRLFKNCFIKGLNNLGGLALFIDVVPLKGGAFMEDKSKEFDQSSTSLAQT